MNILYLNNDILYIIFNKLCLKSIFKNSSEKHELIIHVNDGSDGTLEYVKKIK